VDKNHLDISEFLDISDILNKLIKFNEVEGRITTSGIINALNCSHSSNNFLGSFSCSNRKDIEHVLSCFSNDSAVIGFINNKKQVIGSLSQLVSITKYLKRERTGIKKREDEVALQKIRSVWVYLVPVSNKQFNSFFRTFGFSSIEDGIACNFNYTLDKTVDRAGLCIFAPRDLKPNHIDSEDKQLSSLISTFSYDNDLYRTWLWKNPEGYVVNCNILHKSNCIALLNSSTRTGNKICIKSKEKALEYLHLQKDGIKRCAKCNP